jgi:hypothetical protein
MITAMVSLFLNGWADNDTLTDSTSNDVLVLRSSTTCQDTLPHQDETACYTKRYDRQ